MKKTLFIIIFFSMFFSIYAQTGTVKGTVTDQQSEMPVIGATVQLEGTEGPVGAVTDIDGYFILNNVPAGFGVVGLSHNLIIGEKSYIRTVLGGSLQGNNFEQDRYYNHGSEEEDKQRITEVDNAESRFTLSTYFNSKVNARLALQLSIIAIMVPLISTSLAMLLNAAYRVFGTKDLFEPTLFQGLSSTYVLTFAIAMFYEAIYFFHKFKEAIQEKDRIRMAQIQGQLDNLHNQVNPHFLFNSLNTLMNLIPTDPGRAMNYLDKLSKFYRYAVSNHDRQLVPLQTELDNTHIYAALLQERFHDGIRITLPKEAPGNAQILPLSLQLLIENAVKHNIVSRKKPLHITVEVTPGGKAILVKNNIQKKIREDNSTGVGLKNIRSRMAFFTEAQLIVAEEDLAHFTLQYLAQLPKRHYLVLTMTTILKAIDEGPTNYHDQNLFQIPHQKNRPSLFVAGWNRTPSNSGDLPAQRKR